MAIDDVATTLERLVGEIHRQLGDIPPPIPIYEIARALDIHEIQEKPLNSFEGILITDAARDFGIIGVNKDASYERKRYSVGHELGHFLCQWHVQTQGHGFRCSKQDMALPKGNPIHIRQENEANQFAIELLAPKRYVAPYLKRYPDLEHVLSLHSKLHISKTAAARRFVNLHKECLAAVFIKDGQYLYSERPADFPFIALERGQALPPLPKAGRDTPISEMVEADPKAWPGLNWAHELSVQCLYQDNGHAIVLLHLTAPEDEQAD